MLDIQTTISSDPHFPTPLQEFQFYDKYSRYNYDLGRRETWAETVRRAVTYLKELSKDLLDPRTYERIYDAIINMSVMPSMRLLAMAGPAARRQNLSLYNCAYLAIDSIDALVEPLIISMAGCGVGFSVERQYVEKLPIVRSGPRTSSMHVIDDSTEGWANALRIGITSWFNGLNVDFDYSGIRPAGSPLRTKGGQASGPLPLFNMLETIKNIILNRAGRKLRPIDAHDIICHIGNAAVCGGHRRTAMISLFDSDEGLMLGAKTGTFGQHRWNANNSVVWNELPSYEQFSSHFTTLHESDNGEPGIFNRSGINVPERRQMSDFGTNPCGEIILRNMQTCNLSAVIARPYDDYKSLADKVEVATIIGTIQASATHFPGLRPEWQQNAEEERLLGVDITGQMDSPVVQDPGVMERLRSLATMTNRIYANKLGINPAAAITCVKPSGNTSTMVSCSSGLHAAWSPYYIRRAMVSVQSPIFRMFQDQGVPMEPYGKGWKDATTASILFPVKAPEGAITRKDRTAIEQCEYWLRVKTHWTDHNPSCTITYNQSEFPALKEWVWEHRDVIGGLSFLPTDDHVYEQAPYQEIDRETYERLSSQFPPIDFSRLPEYEDFDQTTASQEVACSSGRCDII